VVGGVTALALFAGVGCGLGIMFVILGARGSVGFSHPSKLVNWRGDHNGTKRIAVAVGVGLVVALVTRWPVGGILAAALVGSWHTLFGQQLSASHEVARIEAIASWTEMLRDTMAAAAGLEQAITTTAPIAPKPIRAELIAMASRIETREVSLAQALPDLADALGDPTADLVVAALSSAAERRARSLGDLLGALAASAREDATMRMRVQASRARVRTAARIVTCVTLAMAGGLVLFKHDFLSPYSSAEGQVVLTVVGCVFAAAFWWLTKMSDVSSPERFLTGLRARGSEAS
jgi:Flp pilus assembly protein TadB